MLNGIVAEEATREDISGIARDQTGDGAVVEVRVLQLALLEADRGTFRHQVHAEGAVLGHVVPFHELCHVEPVVVAGHVEIITSV